MFVLSCMIALFIPLIRGGLRQQLQWQPGPTGIQRLLFGFPVMLVLYAIAALLKIDAASHAPYFLVAYVGYWVLSCLKLEPVLRGIILLLLGFTWLPLQATGVETDYLPLLSFLFGLVTARLSNAQPGWEDFTLPATLLIGNYWIALSMPETAIPAQMGLLLIFIALGLLLRTIAILPLFPKGPALLQPAFLTLTGGLSAWLTVQTLLWQPNLLHWVWLFSGGLGLAFLLAPPSATEDHATEEPPILNRIIQVVLIGLATLVASRLYGTLGWLVLATALLVNHRVRPVIAIAALFWLSRSLLQGFIFQFNPNVTGINITHPYAGAALYVGFIVMMLLPILTNRLATTEEGQPNTIIYSGGPLAWALTLSTCILAGGLANYFLHAEATGSLLASLTVAGLGVSLLGNFHLPTLSVQPLMFTLLITSSALLGNELIATGNESEKSQKILVLGGAFLLYALIFWLMQRSASGRKPVAIA
ncbi:MAG TPA: hypothetical protein V6C52_13035 [Coleofasciculaceae cyanobacterium]